MVKRSVVVRLKDILAAIDEAASFSEGTSFAEYCQDSMKRRAVERCIEIVSEASRHIPEEVTSKYPTMPWADIRGVGNVLRHEYQRVEALIIWKTATSSLPDFRTVIVAMIAEIESKLELSARIQVTP